MTITISNLSITNNVPTGTIIGRFTARDISGDVIPCNYTLLKDSAGHFSISDNKLLTAWGMPVMPGLYSVGVRAVGSNGRFSDSAKLSVAVLMSAPPPPRAPAITVNGSVNAVVAEGAGLRVNVANGPGNRTDWVGLAAAGSADTAFIAWLYLSGSQTAPNPGKTSATVMMTAPMTDASYEARFYVNDSYTVLTRTSFTVRGSTPPAAQPVITVVPNAPEVPDTTPLGAVVASYTVVMSDGTPFIGTVSFGAPFFDGGGVFALSGNNIIVNPAGPGLGPNMTSITDHITLEAIP